MQTQGKVYLLGAGPGDPDLITRRALRRLQQADVVLYDALVHADILQHCKAEAELVFVGKRAHRAHQRQTQINERLVKEARAGKQVVRLKGGDPYLFGRGSEEAEHLHAAGIEMEVVPGVPSPLAATAYAGISLTHRDLASSVAYLTATESVEKDKSAHDWAKLATATQTLVIFMGMRKLELLMRLLMEHGRSPDCPAAVVQWASLPSQRTVVGTVENIAQKAGEAGVGMPALTIVGDVVSLRAQLRWYDLKPLFGKRVLVTRPAGQGAELAQALRDEAAQPIEIPTVRIVPPSDPQPLRNAVARLQAYDWLIFTSVNGVRFFMEALRGDGGDMRRLGGLRVAAIGPATGEALEQRGVVPDVVPEEHRGEAVADAITEQQAGGMRGLRILLPRAAVARETLPQMLREAGADVHVVEAYRSMPPDAAAAERLRELLANDDLDIATFTASSTLSNLIDILDEPLRHKLNALTLASIGPITTQTAQQAGLHVDVTAQQYTTAGLLEALVEHARLDATQRGG